MIKTHRQPSALTETFLGNFNHMMNDILQEGNQVATHAHSIAINLAEKENGYEILAALPGMQKDQIEVNVEDSLLTIAATSSAPETGNKTRKHLIEIPTGTFKRVIKLPKNTDTNQVDATYEGGVLKLYLAKRKETLPRHIEIK